MPIDTETEYYSKEEQEAAEDFNKGQLAQVEIPAQPSSSIIKDINNVAQETSESNSENTEFKLTPEIKQIIMQKLKDIDADGTAFTSLSFAPYKDQNAIQERFGNVVEMGLLGTNGLGGDDLSKEEFVKDWYKTVRTNPVSHSEVYFNIVGRVEGIKRKNQIKNVHMITTDGVGLLMDISGLRELPQGKYNKYKNSQEKFKYKASRTFSADRRNQGIGYYAQTMGDWFRKPELGSRLGFKVPAFTGFVTPYRIAPRFLQGAVVNSTDQEVINNYRDIMIAKDQDKPERLMPIYNTDGDLLWPEQMSHEEIKQQLNDRKKLEEVKDQIAQA